MKVLINSIEKVKSFVKIAESIDTDIFLKCGRYVIDGQSIMGIFSLNLSDNIEMEITEKVNGEAEDFCNRLREAGIAVEE